ncbi:hypothetical protein MYX76_18505, partial [Desulfobacterota bacterium AH_259_B03_O07]|nr:hypothetical protein [Desulfobacterota bacterium AH_259_B03_O07]
GQEHVKRALEVAELEHKIRDVFNIRRGHAAFRKNRASYKQACSALDAIGDTALAITDYLAYEEPSETGINYIFVYGVLQAIYLQQDATKHLARSLGLPFDLPKDLKKIRKLRNDSIGHPTQRDINKKKGIYSFHFISRAMLSKEGFKLLSTYSNKESYDAEDVNLIEVIKIQCQSAEQLLEK